MEPPVTAFLKPVNGFDNALLGLVFEQQIYLEMKIDPVQAQYALAVRTLAMYRVDFGSGEPILIGKFQVVLIFMTLEKP
jgi:hypothetical protein